MIVAQRFFLCGMLVGQVRFSPLLCITNEEVASYGQRFLFLAAAPFSS